MTNAYEDFISFVFVLIFGKLIQLQAHEVSLINVVQHFLT